MAANADIVAGGAWSRLRQDVGAIIWCSFLAACFATVLFFAIFDPLYLRHDDSPPAWLADRRTGYALGFFFFWMTSAIAAGLTVWLVETRSKDVADRCDRS